MISFIPGEIFQVLPKLAGFSFVSVDGLMAMAHAIGGRDVARRDFARLRELRNQLQQDVPDNVSLEQLSMGMSNDYVEAVEEGATIVRIGRSLFEGIR